MPRFCSLTGKHPAIVQKWLDENAEATFQADPNYKLNKRERRHRWMMKLERLLGRDLTKKHYTLVKD